MRPARLIASSGCRILQPVFGHPVKKSIRQLFSLACTTALVASLPVMAHAKEEKSAATGSIRPVGAVKSAALPALAKISFEAAMKTALHAAPGAIIKAELEVEDGSLMYSFEIVGAHQSVTEVEIDAGNGQVLGVDHDEPGQNENSGKK